MRVLYIAFLVIVINIFFYYTGIAETRTVQQLWNVCCDGKLLPLSICILFCGLYTSNNFFYEQYALYFVMGATFDFTEVRSHTGCSASWFEVISLNFVVISADGYDDNTKMVVHTYLDKLLCEVRTIIGLYTMSCCMDGSISVKTCFVILKGPKKNYDERESGREMMKWLKQGENVR